VTEKTDLDSEPRLVFTAPWDPVIERRGDPLGLRALADQFADALAPDLSNRVHDGRWVTILAWCLVRSQQVFHAGGGRASITTRVEQWKRYAWLRPLELMWVARTIRIADNLKGRQLAGVRRVKRWCDSAMEKTARFGMSGDQFRAYRQTGMYGAYRLAFRKWPGMTEQGDGWTPGKATRDLANWLNGKLGTATPPWSIQDDDNVPAPDKRSDNKEHVWWLNHWETYLERGRNADQNTLPRPRSWDDDLTILPEGHLLKGPLFEDDQHGKKRLLVAQAVANSAARNHLDVCGHLAHVFADDSRFAVLPHFSRLADAGMKAMDFVAESLKDAPQVQVGDVAAQAEAVGCCDELMEAARAWQRYAQAPLPPIDLALANRFAHSISSATRPMDCLRELLIHHQTHGGGLHWFALRDGWIERRKVGRGAASPYRFRLWSLCRLAAQCGILKAMPGALLGDDEAEGDETREIADE